MKRDQTTIRLTIRMPEALEAMLRAESKRRGTNLNQTMLSILTNVFYSSGMITPRSFS